MTAIIVDSLSGLKGSSFVYFRICSSKKKGKEHFPTQWREDRLRVQVPKNSSIVNAISVRAIDLAHLQTLYYQLRTS